MTIFADKPLNFPRLNSGFSELKNVINEIVVKMGKTTFTAQDCEKALLRLVRNGRYTLESESAGGRSREFIKLWRWLGITTSINTKEPLIYALTRIGQKFVEENDEQQSKEIYREIMLSWKIYLHLWIHTPEEPKSHRVRPSYLIADILYSTGKRCRAIDIYLTALMLAREDPLACRSRFIQLISDESNTLTETLLAAIRPTRMTNVMNVIETILKHSKDLKTFKKKIDKKLQNTKKSAQWGWNTFKEGKLGHSLTQLFFKKKITLNSLIDEIFIKNNIGNARRSMGPLLKLLIQSEILRKAGPDLYEISTDLSSNGIILQRPPIWYDDLENNQFDPIIAGYVIEFLNEILRQNQGRPLNLNEKELISFLTSKPRATKIQSYSTHSILLQKEFTEKELNKIIDFLISTGVIYRVAGNRLKISRRIDFNIEYDIPRERLPYKTLSVMLKNLSSDALQFKHTEVVDDIYFMDFDEKTCAECIAKFGGYDKVPCVMGCASEFNGESRVNLINIDNDKTKLRPQTCIGCTKCYVTQPRINVKFQRRVVNSTGVCPGVEGLTIDLKSSRLKVNHDECSRCMLCVEYCPFDAVLVSKEGFPYVCNPSECNRSCVTACIQYGLKGIRPHSVEPDQGFVDVFPRAIKNTRPPVSGDGYVPDSFVKKIVCGDENTTLNPWVAFTLNVLLQPKEVRPFEIVPTKQEEADLLVISPFGWDLNLIVELKSSRKGSQDAHQSIKQAGDYVTRFKKNNNQKYSAIVVKDLCQEKGLIDKDLRENWLKSTGMLLETYDVKGIISPSKLWSLLYEYQQNQTQPMLYLKELFESKSLFVLDPTFKKIMNKDFL